MKSIRFVTFGFCLVLLLGSCLKHDVAPSCPSRLLASNDGQDRPQFRLRYDEQGHFVQKITLFEIEHFIYAGNRLDTMYATDTTERLARSGTKYSYDALDRLTQKKFYRNGVGGYTVIRYEYSDHLISEYQDSTLSRRYELDDEGNVARMYDPTYSGPPMLETTFTYDNKHNPYEVFRIIDPTQATHNILVEAGNYYSNQYFYDYNEKGYAIKRYFKNTYNNDTTVLYGLYVYGCK